MPIIALAAGGGAGAGPGKIFLDLFSHTIEHELFWLEAPGDNKLLVFTNHTLLQLIVLGLLVLIFYNVARLAQKLDRPKGLLQNMFESVVLYVRDEMVNKFMPKQYAEKLLPLFLTFFTFILFCNLLGLIPIPGIGGTATGNVGVTGALASITFAVMIGGGMIAVGPGKFWKSLVPHGVPAWVSPLMFIIEVIGLVIKAFALTMRLFANMVAGHLVILSFFGLVLICQGYLMYIVAVPSVAMCVFITLLEVLVAFIQAYVFTFLSILFISMCVHPEH